MTPQRQFEVIVLPALAEYAQAERALSNAQPDDLENARMEAMRRARTASIELHQFADAVAKSASPPRDVGQVRQEAEAHCTFLRQGGPIQDISLLRDVAEAFKHHTLDRANASVQSADATITATQTYGQLRWGEGKWGGVEQVIVRKSDGSERALSSILQNCADAWRRVLGQALPDIGDFTS